MTNMMRFEKVSSDADLKKDVKIIKKEFVDLNKYLQKVNEKHSNESPVINFLRQNLSNTTETSRASENTSKTMKMLSLTPGLNLGTAGAGFVGHA